MRLTVLMLVALTLYGPTAGFSFTADKRDTLRGLRDLSVLVEYLPDDVEREGLNREHLQRDIEARLRQAGLHVLTISEVANSPGAPYLYVAVYPIQNPSLTLNAYAVTLTLKQLVQLSRNPTTELFATTWEGPVHLSAVNDSRVLDIRSRILEAVGRFIVDYRDVNAK
ncbi:MAG TPA: hypothetical protein VJR03_07415 [Nitrospira sp.]|nr:hypothetical protein [Nitrospira sp.]